MCSDRNAASCADLVFDRAAAAAHARGGQNGLFLAGREAALERQVRAVNWLRCSGLFDGTLLLVTTDADETARVLAEALTRRYLFVECCTYEDLKDGLRER